MRKIPFAGVELTSQRDRGLRGTSELPGRPASILYIIWVSESELIIIMPYIVLCFCLCSLFYRDDVLCWLLLARPFLYAFHAHLRFPVDLVWFRLSCDHGWIRSGSVNVRKQQQQQPSQEGRSRLSSKPVGQLVSLAHTVGMVIRIVWMTVMRTTSLMKTSNCRPYTVLASRKKNSLFWNALTDPYSLPISSSPSAWSMFSISSSSV